VTHSAVRSGARVAAGDLILEIDSSGQRAAVASLESVRAARIADLEWAKIEAERQRTLLDAGAASRRELDIAETALRTAEAQLTAIEEQIREQRVALDYFRVTAPVAGVVGDIPVRVGDRVAPGVALTSIDSAGALELYVYVPVEHARELRRGLPVEIVDAAGAPITTTAIDFISPQIDDRTQSVLAKAPVTDDAGFRTEQLVRTRVVWGNDPGLTVPVTAVSRIAGAYFAFVAESGPQGDVARQRRLRVGEIIGNDYVLIDGLAAGDRLIVSGVQKIYDGAPVDTGTQG
jgi:RND family efflux transporter MFP subunit